MNEAWQLFGIIAVLVVSGWLVRALAARLALKKLQHVATHRLNLEQCWLLVSQVPGPLLSVDTRRALGKVLSHHLAHSRRSGTNESAQELRIARLVGHVPTEGASGRPSETLAHALRQLMKLVEEARAQGILSVSEHIRAHDHLYRRLAEVEQELAQRKAQIDELLHLPFGRRVGART